MSNQIGIGLWGQLSEQGQPDFPLPSYFPKAFPGQPSDIVTSACPGSSLGSPPGGACLEHPPRKVSRGHPILMAEPPQLAPLDVEGQLLYSELLPGDRAPHLISKGVPHHPAEETHLSLVPDLILLGTTQRS